MAAISREPAQAAPPQNHFEQNHPLRRYGIAIAIVLAATILRLVFLPSLGMRVAFVTFYPAITLAALYGGLRAGVLATLISGAVADYFWMEPSGSFIKLNPISWLALAIFVASGLLMSWVAEKLHRANARQRLDLEALVAERTAALTREIAERQRTEAALRESEARYRALAERLKRVFESRLLGLVYWNMNGDIVDANDKFLEMVGYERADLAAGRIDWKQMTPPEFAHLGSFVELKATSANSMPFEKEYIRKDGSRIPVLAARVMFDEAHGDGVAFVIDISDRKRAEQALALAKAEAERANIAKSKFLAAASHDLRQPVQSLTLLLSVIKRQVKDKPKTAAAVDMAKTAIDSLSGLLTGILDISKLDAGVVAPEMASVNLGEMIDRMANEYAPRATAEGLTLRHVSSALWARTDAVLMERIMRNLIENALRYTEKGGILIGPRRRGGKVRLDVIDTGIGIPVDQQAEIFDEFRQLHNPARDASRGLGLGLAIASRLSHLLGAPVDVASRVGHGSRFSLLLPLDQAEAPAVEVAPALEGAGSRILVIEDDFGIRQAYEMMLEDWGYQTITAASGEEAIERAALADWEFDAIIADHRLGSGLTGNATAADIGRRAGRSYPTMVVTGDTAKERLAEISASGFITLHKPVEADDLRQTLESLLRGDAGPH